MVSLIRPYSSFFSWALVRTVKCTFEKQTPLQVFTAWLCIGKHLHQSAQINMLIEYFLTLSLLWPCACHFLIREICQCLFEEFDIFCYFWYLSTVLQVLRCWGSWAPFYYQWSPNIESTPVLHQPSKAGDRETSPLGR